MPMGMRTRGKNAIENISAAIFCFSCLGFLSPLGVGAGVVCFVLYFNLKVSAGMAG